MVIQVKNRNSIAKISIAWNDMILTSEFFLLCLNVWAYIAHWYFFIVCCSELYM